MSGSLFWDTVYTITTMEKICIAPTTVRNCNASQAVKAKPKIQFKKYKVHGNITVTINNASDYQTNGLYRTVR